MDQAAPGETSDADLVARLPAGDARALAELVRRHGPRLRALVFRFAGSSGEADDIVQETFWTLWQKSDRWQPDGPPFAAWLTRIAINRAIDRERRRKVRQFFGIEAAAEASDAGIDADRAVASRQELAAVVRDIAELPPRQRVAILLSAGRDLSNAEIAATLRLSEGAAEQLLVRARRTLRTRLAERDA